MSWTRDPFAMIGVFLLVEWARLRCWVFDHDPLPAQMVDAMGLWQIRCRRCGKEILQ